MFKTVTVPTKYGWNKTRADAIFADTVDDTVDGGSKMSNISRSKDRNTEAATAQFLMGP